MDEETITISDGNITVTFEFDDDAEVAPGNVAIDITGGLSAHDMQGRIMGVINAQNMNLNVIANDIAGIILYNKDFGGGNKNTDIISNVADNNFVVEGMDGGKEDGRDFTAGNWKYIRIYSGTGAGQVAEIAHRGKGFIRVNNVWETTSNIAGDGTIGESLYERKRIHNFHHFWIQHDYSWITEPGYNTNYIIVNNTNMWRGWVNHAVFGLDDHEFPALWSVKEILADQALEELNDEVMNIINDNKNDIVQNMGKTEGGAIDYLDNSDFLKLPVVYFGIWDGTDINNALAFFPNMVNCQPISAASIVMPKQFGARNDNNEDVFEAAAESIVGAGIITFANDWNLYHRLMGGLHCGTAAKRALPVEEWWEQLSN